jgi:hypothetical protein
MNDESKKPEATNIVTSEAPETKKRFHAFKYWADVIKWIVNLIGDLVDSVKENPFPKKDDYTD